MNFRRIVQVTKPEMSIERDSALIFHFEDRVEVRSELWNKIKSFNTHPGLDSFVFTDGQCGHPYIVYCL